MPHQGDSTLVDDLMLELDGILASVIHAWCLFANVAGIISQCIFHKGLPVTTMHVFGVLPMVPLVGNICTTLVPFFLLFTESVNF